MQFWYVLLALLMIWFAYIILKSYHYDRNGPKLILKGNDFMEQGDCHRAIQIYQKVLDMESDNPAVNYKPGCAYLRIHEREKALERY